MATERDPSTTSDRLATFFLLACGITWGCAAPGVVAWIRGGAPTSAQMGLLGLSALGPLLATLIVTSMGTSRPERRRAAFGPWRVHPGWLVLAVCTPTAVDAVGRVLDRLFGGPVVPWIYLPDRPEFLMALLIFPLGEEFGWRGFAQPRMTARFGPVRGPLLLGVVWALWHSMYLVSAQTGRVESDMALTMLSLPGWSLVFAWMMQRAGGSIAVALALHVGAHVDKVDRLPIDAVSTRVWIVVAASLAGTLAARSLSRTARASSTGQGT